MRPVLLALTAAVALPLLVFARIGAFSRYTADDFCWAGILRTEGFLNAQVHYYVDYSPRYAFTFLVNLTELIGPAIVPALPATAIVVWLVVFTWTLRQFGIDTLPGFLLAEVGAFAVFETAPDLPQSLYWQTGMLTYVLPLILATFLIGWVRRANPSWWSLLVSGVATFIAGGLSETYLIPQNVALTLALLAYILADRRSARTLHLAAALAGGVLALVAITLAPSTAGRVGGYPADLWLALSASMATAYVQIVRLVRFFPFIIALCIGVPLLLDNRCIRPAALFAATAVVAFTLPFCYFPSFYAQNGNPPARSLIVPGALLVGYLMFLGFAIRPMLGQRLTLVPSAVALAALALVPIGVAATTLPDQASAAEYAALFDAEDRQIRASRDAGQSDLLVPPLPPNFGENFVGSDPQDWFNMCVARYYGLRSIATAGS